MTHTFCGSSDTGVFHHVKFYLLQSTISNWYVNNLAVNLRQVAFHWSISYNCPVCSIRYSVSRPVETHMSGTSKNSSQHTKVGLWLLHFVYLYFKNIVDIDKLYPFHICRSLDHKNFGKKKRLKMCNTNVIFD